jgi:hypothetical protein
MAMMPSVHLLDHVAGNVRSLVNAIEKVGYTVHWIKEPNDVEAAEVGVAYLPLYFLSVYMLTRHLRDSFCRV